MLPFWEQLEGTPRVEAAERPAVQPPAGSTALLDRHSHFIASGRQNLPDPAGRLQHGVGPHGHVGIGHDRDDVQSFYGFRAGNSRKMFRIRLRVRAWTCPNVLTIRVWSRV